MRILLWHGYLLSGSGANIYTAEVAKRWRESGHDVLLMCQEQRGAQLEFVDEDGDFAQDNQTFDLHRTGVLPAGGRVRLVRPFIGDILPVYVYDRYEGFTAKRYVDLSDAELAYYTERNVEALVAAIREHKPDVFVTGHEVMGPYIALQAREATGRTYVAKLHGSPLEYAIKIQQRYVRYASEGLNGASAVIGGSNYMVREASSIVPGWKERATVVNPGCDVDLFLRSRRAASADAVTVGFVGKLIAAKGIHHFLGALGLIDIRPLRAVVVGYGEMEDEARALWNALKESSREDALECATRFESGHDRAVSTWLSSEDANDAYWSALARVSTTFTGRLEHGPLAELLPGFDILVVASIVPEAFGMVAVEAAACGVLPVVPRHSGIMEIGRALEDELGVHDLLTFDHRDPVREIARVVSSLLRIPVEERKQMGDTVAALAEARWSWKTVAERLLEVATAR